MKVLKVLAACCFVLVVGSAETSYAMANLANPTNHLIIVPAVSSVYLGDVLDATLPDTDLLRSVREELSEASPIPKGQFGGSMSPNRWTSKGLRTQPDYQRLLVGKDRRAETILTYWSQHNDL